MTRANRWIATEFGGPEVLELVEVELPAPSPGEVMLEVRAAGMNPADLLHLNSGDPASLPLTVGYEAAGVLTAVGPDTAIACGKAAAGDEVIAFQIIGAYASAVTVAAGSVFAKPANLTFAEAATLLLVGTTAAEMLDVTNVARGETIVVHGASGAVGLSVLQQARLLGARVIGTASSVKFDTLTALGAIPVQYGTGLEDRIRALAPEGVHACLDTVGTDEAVDVSLRLVADRSRVVSIAAFGRSNEGFPLLGAGNPSSGPFRESARARILELAANGELVSTIAATFSMSQAREALTALGRPHGSGKLALVAD